MADKYSELHDTVEKLRLQIAELPHKTQRTLEEDAKLAVLRREMIDTVDKIPWALGDDS